MMTLKNVLLRLVVMSVVFSLYGVPLAVTRADPGDKDVRASILAGSWYPKDPQTLIKSINGYLARIERKDAIKGEIVAAIVPHAGYLYSGPVAAYAYHALKERRFERAIIIGPSHRFGFRGASVNIQSAYKTPLGISPVDHVFAKKLINENELVRYIPEAHANEHSIEIQLPFLQVIHKDFSIVPIIIGDRDYRTYGILSDCLIKLMGNNKGTIIIASSDLSHYHDQDQAKRLDMEFIRHIKDLDPEGLAKALSSGSCEACGSGPVITTMLVAKALGADHTSVLRYATSGDVTGDMAKVVGYVSAAFIISE